MSNPARRYDLPGRPRWLNTALALALALPAAGCTAVLGIDKDYHLDGDGGAGGNGGSGASTTTGGAGGAGGTGAGGNTTTGGACVTAADCTIAEPECQSVVGCEGGTCVYDNEPEGTPLSAQTAGDCAEIVCDGQGSTQLEPLASDVEDDSKECTLDTCDGTTPVHALQDSVPCYTGPQGTQGVGICTAGARTCGANGEPGDDCAGEVLPTTEDCDDDRLDQDCDGAADESGPSCVCGDGNVSNDESCDGGGVDTASCDLDCTVPICGDVVLNTAAGEECDDGGTSDADACSALCKHQNVLAVTAGLHHTCALLSSGAVKCWGGNGRGQLGLGDTAARGDQAGEMGAALPAVDLGQPAKAITAGDEHTCAILANDQVKCWGRNDTGALGLGDAQDRGDQAGEMGNALPAVALGAGLGAQAISAGRFHTCALLSNEQVKCWGSNTQGQLGLGDTAARGDQAGEMGDALPTVPLGVGFVPIALAVGGSSCALLLGAGGGSLKCWGPNTFGALGLGDTFARGDGPGEMGGILPVIDLGSFASPVSAAAGAEHTCARIANGALVCWGRAADGQLGDGIEKETGDNPGEMGDALIPASFPVGVVTSQVTAGEAHTCALRVDGLVKCWGRNTSGQTGAQPSDAKHATVSLGVGLVATAVEAGASHTCAILGGRLKCWGGNASGQLGLGDVENRDDGPSELGDALPFLKLWNDQW